MKKHFKMRSRVVIVCLEVEFFLTMKKQLTLDLEKCYKIFNSKGNYLT